MSVSGSKEILEFIDRPSFIFKRANSFIFSVTDIVCVPSSSVCMCDVTTPKMPKY